MLRHISGVHRQKRQVGRARAFDHRRLLIRIFTRTGLSVVDAVSPIAPTDLDCLEESKVTQKRIEIARLDCCDRRRRQVSVFPAIESSDRARDGINQCEVGKGLREVADLFPVSAISSE